MTKKLFSEVLAEHTKNIQQRGEPIAVEPTSLITMLVKELEVENPVKVIPLFGKEIHISDEMADVIQIKPTNKPYYFSVWGVETLNSFYFLIGTDIRYFSDKRSNDPFRESDDFFQFSTQLMEELGFINLLPYFSESDFFIGTQEFESKRYEFFLYKV